MTLSIGRILGAVALIVFVGAAAASATGAFFSDTETSTGNTFTAGAIDLKVDSQSHYDGLICSEVTPGIFHWIDDPADATPVSRPELIDQNCDGTWAMTDLGPTHKFFNLADVKPGDDGEDTISLHVDNNPAYACVDISVPTNDDVTCTEPENASDAENGACNNSVPTATMDGDLAQNLDFFAWLDDGAVDGFQNSTTTPNADPTEGDNIWQSANELPLFSNVHGPLSDAIPTKTYTLAAPPLAPLPAGGNANYIGLAWCAGTFDNAALSGGTLLCDGASMGNVAQTDQATADVTFRVEQSRNNGNFTCALPPQNP